MRASSFQDRRQRLYPLNRQRRPLPGLTNDHKALLPCQLIYRASSFQRRSIVMASASPWLKKKFPESRPKPAGWYHDWPISPSGRCIKANRRDLALVSGPFGDHAAIEVFPNSYEFIGTPLAKQRPFFDQAMLLTAP